MSKLPDSEIEQWVLREIGLTARESREICVYSHNGVVTLQGTVKSFDQKMALNRAAQIAKGVICVIDDVRVKMFAESPLSEVTYISSVTRRTGIPSRRSAPLQSPARRHA
jgi:hypothetical protein